MKKSKARKVLNVLEGLEYNAQKKWLVDNRYATSDTDAEFKSVYDSITSAAEL